MLLGSLSLAALSLAFAAPAEASGFSGPYAPANWTFTANGGDGSVNTAGAPASINLTGSNNGIGEPTNYTINSVVDGQVSFSWSYSSVDSPGYDSFGYLLNGNFNFLANSNGQTDTTAFSVAAGDSFGFSITSLDGIFGPGIATISNFSAPVPEPLTLLGATAAVGFGAAFKRRSGEASEQK